MKFPDQYRWRNAPFGYGSSNSDQFGMFRIPGLNGNRPVKAMACDGEETGWEHVSVSLDDGGKQDRCPSWSEMCAVKELFWNDDEAVIQFHPPKSEYVNQHAGCLHLWRCVNQSLPLPPSILVGNKNAKRVS